MDGFDSRYNVQLTYDGLNRLDKIQDSYLGTGDVNYDTMGNITYYKIGSRVLNYHYNSKNQLHEITGSKPYTFTYDDMGNVKNNSKRNFTYKTDNLMVESDGYLYTYDGNSKRVKEIGSSGNPIYSFYGTNGKLMYRKENNQHIDYYYLGNKLVAKRKANEVTYIHADYLGSPAAESRSNGFLTKRLHYQPFGESIEPPKDDVGYTGHKFDTDLGLNYMQARYYDPVIGRFYSNDPVDAATFLRQGNIQGFNRYAYANNNPYKYTDPNGENPVCLTPWTALACAGAAAVGYGVYKFTDKTEDLGNSKLKEMEADRRRQEAYINCVKSGGRNCGDIGPSERELKDRRRDTLEDAAEAAEAGCIVGTTCGGSIPSSTEENAVNGLGALWNWITGGDEKEEKEPPEPQNQEEDRKSR